MITRSVLDMRMIVPSEDIHSKVVDKILADQEILEMWEKVASGVPPKYEEASIELLKAVVELWATIRCFSFAAGCNILLQKKTTKKKGTRRVLKMKGTDKDI